MYFLTFSFIDKHLERGKQLLKNGNVKDIVFSGHTYQVEVYDPSCESTFWPFLQINDEGEVKDAFCSCDEVEQSKSCPHLAASVLIINKRGPIHTRFGASFWNKIGLIAFERHGSDSGILLPYKESGYKISLDNGEVAFFVSYKTELGKKVLSDNIFNKIEETEETSLKFSNLDSFELALWRKGSPTQKLRYELSFWSELAKWMFLQQEFNLAYSIDFEENATSLPRRLKLHFVDLEFEILITEQNWQELIFSLMSVKSSLVVHEFKSIALSEIHYNIEEKKFHICSKKVQHKKDKSGIKIDQWEYQPHDGFYPLNVNPTLKKREITTDEMGEFLTQNIKIISKYLKGVPLTEEQFVPQYNLFFDKSNTLNIECYIFEPGDLKQKEAFFYYPWVFLPGKGFFKVHQMPFKELVTYIRPHKLSEFIEKHRLWLNNYEGFCIHLSNMEYKLTFRFDLENLIFESDAARFERFEGVIDFGDWLFIREKGFFKKLQSRVMSQIPVLKKIPAKAVSTFISRNIEDLEHINSFFSPKCPVEKAGVNIQADDSLRIIVTPQYFLRPGYNIDQISFFGDYVYVQNEGFSLLPSSAKLPEIYRDEIHIDKEDEALFISEQLIELKPFIIKKDSKLKAPKNLVLKLKSFKKAHNKKWIVELIYQSEFGSVETEVVKQFLDNDKLYAMTDAGLLNFKEKRYGWLRNIEIIKDNKITLNTMDWIRLKIYENVSPLTPLLDSDSNGKLLMQQFESFQTSDVIDLQGLKSTLRPYQLTGLKWLWFLYTYELSGLLCDDMGLGKTHQAMALMSASHNISHPLKVKYFIVCPTSVIYHWEELLCKFLPSFKVLTFYGTNRNIESFSRDIDILLTSYGTLRSDKKALSALNFEIAVFDEIQIAKNAQSQTHHSLKMLKAKTKIGLSGTPIENRLLELKALFDIVLPGYMPSKTKYKELFINPIEKYNDPGQKKLLSNLIHPFVMRRKKGEVLDDLPEKIEEIAHCELSSEQLSLYRQVVEKSKEQILNGVNNPNGQIPFIHIFSLLNTLKQICNHPALINKDIQNYMQYQSGKWELFKELLKEARDSGQKLVVFTQYLDMMKIIELYLQSQQIGYAEIKGSTLDRKKQLLEFRNNENCEVFIASLKAAGSGVDLTSASVVIHYDRWWNPAKENQATDRVHRIGQNRGVQVFKMVTKCSIEEHIHSLIQKKISLTEGVIGYDDQDQVKHLNRQDLLDLMSKINDDIQ